MNRIYLIARREYLSYVATWGFWLSIALVPFFMSAGVVAPMLAERAASTRYYAVVADDPALEAALDGYIADGRRRELRGAVTAFARLRGADEAREEAALAAFDAAPTGSEGLADAAGVLGLPGAESVRIPESKLVKVDPPARTPEALRPYLLGERTLDVGAAEPHALDAAVFLRRDAEAGVAIDYWGAPKLENNLADTARRAMRDFMRREALARAGVDPSAVAAADALAPRMRELNPEREEGDAAVTFVDRLPFLAGAFMGIGLWIVIFSVVNMLLTAVIEEKGNKILESLLAHANYREILIGKLIGVAGVSATLLTAWASFALLGVATVANAGAALPEGALAAILAPKLIIPFVAYFVLGYLMYGAIFLAIGSLCETIQEAQTLMSPMIFILMAPMLVLPIALHEPDSPIIAVISWIPLYTPFTMMARLASDPPLVDLIGTSLLLLAATVAILWAAGGVFRAGVTGRAGPDAVKKALGRLLKRRRSAAA